MVSRRFLLTTGAASIIVLGGGYAAYKSLHSDLGPAREPWRSAGAGYNDPRLEALSYAILAPNPHNRQPWLVTLQGDDELLLHCDLARLLPETDPPNRQITIGLGAFLELLRQAAAEQGFRAEIESFPEGEPFPTLDERPVAHVRFVQDKSTASDPLFQSVLARRTVRAPFDHARPVLDNVLDDLAQSVMTEEVSFFWTNETSEIERLKKICRESWLIEAGTPHTHNETVELTRIGDDEINANPDGIALHGALMEGLKIAGIITQEKMNDPSSQAYKSTIDFYNAAIDSAMAFGWLTTATNTRVDQLAAGADWVRLHLRATALGLAVHPLSQALQEYPEMAGPFKDIHDYAELTAPARVQGLFRFGYAKFPAPAPRWPLQSRLLET